MKTFSSLLVFIMILYVQKYNMTSSTKSIRHLRLFSSKKNIDTYFQNNRFWSQTITAEKNITLGEVSSYAINNGIDLSRINYGLALIPSLKMIIPIHEGLIQQQHASTVPIDHQIQQNDIIICGFSPRAAHICTTPEEKDRPTDPLRLEALNTAILRFGTIAPDKLVSEEYAGTSPARIYRSFVAPRAKSATLLEPVERAANRTATQIELAMRQLRADKDQYLRNTDRPFTPAAALDPTKHPLILVLDNIRSAFNVGSLFRSAETAGAQELVTCGITAKPPHPKLRKTAMNALDVVPTRHFEDTMSAVRALQADGYTVVAMETTERSLLYTEVIFPEKVALVLGNEVTGVDTRVMEAADMVVEIPTFGVKNSLNVASAAPIVMFEVLRQWARDGRISSRKGGVLRRDSDIDVEE